MVEWLVPSGLPRRWWHLPAVRIHWPSVQWGKNMGIGEGSLQVRGGRCDLRCSNKLGTSYSTFSGCFCLDLSLVLVPPDSMFIYHIWNSGRVRVRV